MHVIMSTVVCVVCSSAGVRSRVSKLHDRARRRHGGAGLRGDWYSGSNADVAQRRSGAGSVGSCSHIAGRQSHHQEYRRRGRRRLHVSLQEPRGSGVSRHQSRRQRSVASSLSLAMIVFSSLGYGSSTRVHRRCNKRQEEYKKR